MSITPQAAAKLGQSRSQNPSIATSVDGLTVGDRGYIQSTLEGVISNAIGGSQKMGGSDGLLDKIDFQLSKFSYEIRAEVKSLFTSLVGQLSSKNDDNEEVKIDEKQFKEMQSDSVNEIFNGGLTKKITSQFKDKVGSFLKGNFITSVFKNKTFKGITDKISQASIYVKTAVGGFIKNIGPKLISYINTSIAYMKTSLKYMVTVGKTMGKISKAIGTIIWRLGAMFVMAAIRFAIFIAALALQTIMIISSIVGSLIVFLTPIALTIASMALGVLFIAGVVFLILFAFYLLYNFVTDWIKNGWSTAIENLFSSEAFKNAISDALGLISRAFGLEPDTLMNLFQSFVNGEFVRNITDWIKSNVKMMIDNSIDSVFKWFTDFKSLVLNAFGTFYKDYLAIYIDPFIKGVNKILGLLGDAWNWLEDVPYIGFVFKWLKDTFFGMWNKVYSWIQNIYEKITGKIQSVSDKIYNFTTGNTPMSKTQENDLNRIALAYNMKTIQRMMKNDGYDPFMITNAMRQIKDIRDAIRIKTQIQNARKSKTGLVKFAQGGIVIEPVLGMLAEAGSNEAVIPLNAQGAKFLAATMEQAGISNIPMSPSNVETIKGIMESVIAEESKSESGSEAVHAKLDMVIGQMRDRQGNNATIVSSDDTSNFIDMIAKGMFE